MNSETVYTLNVPNFASSIKTTDMRYGIIGAGDVAQTIASKLRELGHEVMTSSRGQFADAAKFGERVFNCVQGIHSIESLSEAGEENMRGKILIDLTNPFIYDGKNISLDSRWHGDTSLGEANQALLPETKIVKTLNYLHNHLMTHPDELPEPPTGFYCGNDAEAKEAVRQLLSDFSWTDTLDLGDISASRYTEMLGAFWPAVYSQLKHMNWGFKLVR